MTFIKKNFLRKIITVLSCGATIFDLSCINKATYTEEMVSFFKERTDAHIKKVSDNMQAMSGYCGLNTQILTERANLHDKSKFSADELEGYIWLTWYYRCKKIKTQFEYPEGIEEIVKKAEDHHLKNNRHHPESHEDINLMETTDLVEMVCDLTALSQEYGQESCRSWVMDNRERWKFSESMWKRIFLIIDELDIRLKTTDKVETNMKSSACIS